MKQFYKLPPSTQRSEGFVYDITSSSTIKNADLNAKTEAKQQRWLDSKKINWERERQVTNQGIVRQDLDDKRAVNRQSHQRYVEALAHGYSIVDHRDYTDPYTFVAPSRTMPKPTTWQSVGPTHPANREGATHLSAAERNAPLSRGSSHGVYRGMSPAMPPPDVAPPAALPPAAPPAAPVGWPKPRLTAMAALDAARAMPDRKLELRRPKDPDLTSPVPEADELRGRPAGDSAELRCESGVDELRSEPWARSRSMFDELTSESRGLSGSGVAAAAADAADADAADAVAVDSRSTLSCAASSTSDTPRVRPGAVTLSARLVAAASPPSDDANDPAPPASTSSSDIRCASHASSWKPDRLLRADPSAGAPAPAAPAARLPAAPPREPRASSAPLTSSASSASSSGDAITSGDAISTSGAISPAASLATGRSRAAISPSISPAAAAPSAAASPPSAAASPAPTVSAGGEGGGERVRGEAGGEGGREAGGEHGGEGARPLPPPPPPLLRPEEAEAAVREEAAEARLNLAEAPEAPAAEAEAAEAAASCLSSVAPMRRAWRCTSLAARCASGSMPEYLARVRVRVGARVRVKGER